MTAHRNQREAVIRRYGRELTNREIAEAVRDRTPRLRLLAAHDTAIAPMRDLTVEPRRTDVREQAVVF
jgi:hypothetical protein